MLKALELFGFKSFAERTRFEFPAGITVIVGPNGSGKSNIVDAIKWVLGEQSAKSLRGRDMVDVIFKGSGAGGRRPMNTAEATIVIDNSQGQLPIDAPEIYVTRRIYRSGEGEYLINREPCRLKDIRDLFRGTGVGTDAYSLIEQGKVDQMLQASARDRRAIFEEAAGISRFKAKKIEAQRRLERVDQNLLRLSDIVEEVEGRLRRVRSQASKARRYKEYSERLQELRTFVGLTDWRRLSDRLERAEGEIAQLRQQAAVELAELESVESRLRELETAVAEARESISKCEADAAHNREQIAKNESTITHQRTRSSDFDVEASHHAEQLAALTTRAGDLHGRLEQTSSALDNAKREHRAMEEQLADHDAADSELSQRMDALREENETRREQYVELARLTATLEKQVSVCQSRMSAAEANLERLRRRQGELSDQIGSLSAELDAQQDRERRLGADVETISASHEAAQRQLTEFQRQRLLRQEELARLRSLYSGARERATVLEELENNFEGLDAGVKEVLELARQDPQGPFGEVRGVVADSIQASVETAPLVDIALGERAQYVVLEGGAVVDLLRNRTDRIASRVGLIRLDSSSPISLLAGANLDDLPGVIGRADRMIEVQPRFGRMIARLLGQTWLVDTLARALELSKSQGKGLRFVAADGSLLEADGTLVVGPKRSSTGLISRRSELNALRSEVAELNQQIGAIRHEIVRLRTQVEQQEQAFRQLGDQYKQASSDLADARVGTRALRDRHDQLLKEQEVVAAEIRVASVDRETASSELAANRENLATAKANLTEIDQQVRRTNRQRQQMEQDCRSHQRHATTARVNLARSEQRLESLRATVSRLEADQRERCDAIADLRTRLADCRRRRAQAEEAILRSTSLLAELYLRKESDSDKAVACVAQRDDLVRQQSEFSAAAAKHRNVVKQIEEQQHQKELAASEIRHRRDTLAERLRDDYGIELSELTQKPSDEEQRHRDEIEEEIASLRRKINNIGAVNVEALDELEELEERFTSLSTQYQDLTEAKNLLERILTKINADSRRLFSETLEAIRKNFQVLYRKAFGGGQADIVLEEGVDILEAGVEIMATPPGKPQFNNSLLSGGEKALTAVSLLLAIFQHRPSPFCVLDEVDAPFDEANIGRFMNVLREFLGWTKFVIVTHSKKTMTAATTLYGVTMQESGVSKRVAVKFDDVSDDGHISHEAVQRQQADEKRGVA